jgi:replicative DNA helicase
MAPGHLIVMIGWAGRGKTWMSSYLACKAWEQGFKPMIISLEMTPENMRDRIYTMLGSGLFKASDFSKGNINVDDFGNWAKKKFDDTNGFILVSNEGSGNVTPQTVQAKIDQHKPDIVILDYHQLFTDTNNSKSPTERNMNISREFKNLAVRNNIPIIDISAATMSDISNQDGPPLLSQVAWSKAIEFDADMAMAVHRTPDTNIIEVVSRKNRHGTEFDFYLDWDINRGIVKEIYETPF